MLRSFDPRRVMVIIGTHRLTGFMTGVVHVQFVAVFGLQSHPFSNVPVG